MENVKVTVETKENCVRALDVEVPHDEVTKELDKLFDEAKRMAEVPGFRPGRVPRRVLEKRFGKQLRKQAIDSAVAQSCDEALKSHGLSALHEPDIQDVKFEGTDPLKYRAVIEISPRVLELGEYKGLTLERPVREVRDRDIDQVLENTRAAHAVYVPRDAKPASDGDLLVIDYEGLLDGKPFQGNKGESVTLLLGGRGFFKEFHESLRGLIPESETDVTVKFPEDHDRRDLAGQEIVFHVKVKEVKERVLPALDDAFAKEVGSGDTLDDLRKQVREQLVAADKRRAESALKDAALRMVVEKSKFELPKTAVDHIAEDVFRERVNELHAAGISDTVVSEREEELRKRCAEEAEFMLKAACVEQEIATKEGLIVADEEIEQAKAELKESGIKGETVDEYFNAPDLRERYRWRMLRRKALDLVIEAARIKDVPVSDEDVSVQAPREQGGAAPETGQ